MKIKLLLCFMIILLASCSCFAMSDNQASQMLVHEMKHGEQGDVIYNGASRVMNVIVSNGNVKIYLLPADDPNDSTYRVGVKLDTEGILFFLFYEPMFWEYHVNNVQINYLLPVDDGIKCVLSVSATRDAVYKYNVNQYDAYKHILVACKIRGWKRYTEGLK